MTNKRVEVVLTDEQVQFISWMSKRDNVTFQKELQMMFYTELEQCMNLYLDEMKGELG